MNRSKFWGQIDPKHTDLFPVVHDFPRFNVRHSESAMGESHVDLVGMLCFQWEEVEEAPAELTLLMGSMSLRWVATSSARPSFIGWLSHRFKPLESEH